mgnify:CR=1 FL=1
MQDKEKISIDVVLLLPEKINSICKELNKESDKTDYVSFEDGYNPHLTLGMGSILIKDIDNFKNELNIIIEKFESPEIKIISLGAGKYNHFNIEVSEKLKEIHTKVFDLISKYSAGIVSKENFYEMKEHGSLVDWVNNFKINSAYENYHPHITLGIGVEEKPLEFPMIFKPVSVGFFHLGKHGTCKKLIANFDFR